MVPTYGSDLVGLTGACVCLQCLRESVGRAKREGRDIVRHVSQELVGAVSLTTTHANPGDISPTRKNSLRANSMITVRPIEDGHTPFLKMGQLCSCVKRREDTTGNFIRTMNRNRKETNRPKGARYICPRLAEDSVRWTLEREFGLEKRRSEYGCNLQTGK